MTGTTRRELLQTAAATGAVIALGGPAVAAGRSRSQRPGTKRTVAVLGGGMAGLTAAHELAERGFAVTVYEPTALGGKARSIPVANTARGGRLPLPGEHGFRFFPGFYKHVPDTMRRIPDGGNANGVWDNLEDVPVAVISRAGAEDLTLPAGMTHRSPAAFTPETLAETLAGGLRVGTEVPPHELAEFAQRLLVFLTSCDERRFEQWEHVSWMDFVRAEGKSEAYRRLLVGGLTRSLVAAKESLASTRTIGNMAEAFLMTSMERGNDGKADRVLDGPTNETWIDPWILHLRGLGVRFETGLVESVKVEGGRIAAAGIRDRRGRHRRVEADWFVCAMPAERARALWNRKVRALDPRLEAMDELLVDWMVGVQFFLRRHAPLAAGHVIYVDSPWALTSINQAQFWPGRKLSQRYGDGAVRDILSIDVSDWDADGILFGKPAKRCSRDEIVSEIWAQVKASMNDGGRDRLRDADLHSWFVDPGVRWSKRLGRNVNRTPLLVNTVGSWEDRPPARSAIGNLFLAGDYVQTDIDLATMEGANESARVAVNALLDASNSRAERARTFTLYDPPEYEAAKAVDRERLRAGLPNVLDTPPVLR